MGLREKMKKRKLKKEIEKCWENKFPHLIYGDKGVGMTSEVKRDGNTK